MHKKKVLRIVILALIILWMLVVFGLSNQNGDDSSSLSTKIAQFFFSDEKAQIAEPYIRKLAHLSEYAAGGVLFLSLFLTYNFSEIKKLAFSILVGFEYAVIDEIHQLFVDGRAGKILDVCIDTIGVTIGVCVTMIISKIFSKKVACRNRKI